MKSKRRGDIRIDAIHHIELLIVLVCIRLLRIMKRKSSSRRTRIEKLRFEFCSAQKLRSHIMENGKVLRFVCN